MSSWGHSLSLRLRSCHANCDSCHLAGLRLGLQGSGLSSFHLLTMDACIMADWWVGDTLCMPCTAHHAHRAPNALCTPCTPRAGRWPQCWRPWQPSSWGLSIWCLPQAWTTGAEGTCCGAAVAACHEVIKLVGLATWLMCYVC